MFTNGDVIFSDAWKLWSEVAVGSISPKPPNLTGSASRLLVCLEQGGRPVSEGMNT